MIFTSRQPVLFYGWGGVPVTAVTLVVGIGYYGLIHFHPLYVAGEHAMGERVPPAITGLWWGFIESLPALVDARCVRC